ncbi:MAG: hypothetical protein K5637_06125 [Lachnospiraceae bacterium]|nr:hypothetical protein [Lachnospiraceae bacterium]
MVDSEMGMLVKRPKIERRRNIFVWSFMMLCFTCGVIYELLVCKDTIFVRAIIVAIYVLFSGFLSRYFSDELGRQTFFINQKGITRLRYGKPWKHFDWESFVAIEKHIVYRELRYGREEYEAVLCSTHLIEMPPGWRYLTFDYHRKKANKETVVELVLEKNQYPEFLSYIPEKIKGSGIVKI